MPTPPTGFAAIGFTFLNTLSGRYGQINMAIEQEPTHDLTTVTASLRTGLVDIAQDSTTNIIYVGVRYTFPLSGGDTGSIDVPFAAPLSGAVSGDPMTPQVAYLYKKTTLVFGSHGHGRFYLPGVSEGKVDGSGLVDNTFLTDMNNHAASALSTWAGAGVPMYLLNSGSTPAATIETLAVEPTVATQRRRLARL